MTPSEIYTAQLYKWFSKRNGAPTTTVSPSSLFDALAILNRPSSTASNSVNCPNKSPQVYPVKHNSGYTKNPASAFSFIVWMICATLYVTFATFILGTTVPTFIILFFMIILAEKVTT